MKKIYIPSNLNLLTILDKRYHDQCELDKFHYLIHLIYEQRVLYKINSEYVHLKALYLRRIINDDFELYRELLIKHGIIDCDKVYIKNVKSYGYKLLPPYSEVKHKEVGLTNPRILKNIENWRIKRLPTTPIHQHLYRFLSEIQITESEALDSIKDLENHEYNCSKMAITKFINKEFFLYEDEYGRVHTNITNLKSLLRRYLLHNNEKLVNIDIVNSQPLFLLISLPPSIRWAFSASSLEERSCENDFEHYKNLVEEGKLYDYLMYFTGDTDRGTFKESFFRTTFFGKGVSKVFQELFPSVAKELLKIKKKDYKQLAWNLQRIESKFIISTVCMRIMTEHPDLFITTIHDSIMTTEGNAGIVGEIMEEEFLKLGFDPIIRIENYGA